MGIVYKLKPPKVSNLFLLALSKMNLEVATSPEGKVMSKPLFLR